MTKSSLYTPLFALCLTACAVGPDFVAPNTPPSSNFGAQGELLNDNQTIQEKWWQVFRTPQLDQLIDRSLPNNFSMQAAQAALTASQLSLKSGMGIFLPQINLNATTNKQNYFLAPVANQPIFAINTLTANVSYSLDLFGANRRKIESLQASVDIQQAVQQGVRLTLIGNIVNTSLTVAGYQDQLSILDSMQKNLEETLHLYQHQYEAGLISYDLVLTARNQLNTLNMTRNITNKNLANAQHLLSSLCSLTADQSVPVTYRIDNVNLPLSLPNAVPSRWLKKRPDIVVSESQLHVASANVGVARAAQFPDLTITASAGRESGAFSQLLSGANPIWGIGANLTQPLFSGGSLEANTQAARAIYRETEMNYKQTVVTAFQQVADVMSSLTEDHHELKNQEELLNNATRNQQLAQANWQAGRINRIQYLTAELAMQQSKINWIGARVQTLQDTAEWYLALGG